MEARSATNDAVETLSPAPKDSADARLIQPLLDHETFSIGATQFLSAFASAFEGKRASLGLYVGATLRICALSGHPGALKQTALPEVVAAMEEALMQQVSVIYPQPPRTFPHIVIAHGELSRQAHSYNILTVPLAHKGELIGALTVEAGPHRVFDNHDLAIAEQLARNVAGLIDLRWQLDRPLLQRLNGALRRRIGQLNTLYPSRLKIALGIGGALLAALLFAVPVKNHVTANARLEAQVQRVVTVPVDGYLKQIHVRPGDSVKAGQILADLEDESIVANQKRLESEIKQRENALADAMLRNDRVQLGVNRGKLDEAQTQLELTNLDLARAHLSAPFDGVVIQGDMVQLLGAPLKRGDTLLVLSQGKDFRVIANVDERDIQDVKIGQSGQLRLAAFPNKSFEIRIVRITPVATATEGTNTFEVEATLAQGITTRLTPGLKGVVKIEREARPLGTKWVEYIGRRAWFLAWSWLA